MATAKRVRKPQQPVVYWDGDVRVGWLWPKNEEAMLLLSMTPGISMEDWGNDANYDPHFCIDVPDETSGDVLDAASKETMDRLRSMGVKIIAIVPKLRTAGSVIPPDKAAPKAARFRDLLRKANGGKPTPYDEYKPGGKE